jgi:ubiquinone biosynthesis protein UbiJ
MDAPLSSASSVDQGDVRALAATVRALEQQIAGLSKRVEELFREKRYLLDPGAAR